MHVNARSIFGLCFVVLACLLGRVLGAHGLTYSLSHTLQKSPAAAGDEFGGAVALMGPYLLVGIPGDDTGATDAGVVNFYDASTGALLHVFQNPSPGNPGFPTVTDRFGAAIAVLGTRVIIGAPGANGGAVGSGEVYVFNGDRTSPSFGQLLLTLQDPTPHVGGEFGAAAAGVGPTIIVGNPGQNIGTFLQPIYAGEAHLFDAGNGAFLVTVPNPEGEMAADGDDFGRSIATLSVHFAIGAPGKQRAYLIYGNRVIGLGTPDPSLGNLLYTFNSPTPSVPDDFGYAMTHLGKSLVVGAPAPATSLGGAVYIIDADSSSPTLGTLQRTLQKFAPVAGDQFGYSVATFGTQVLVGTPQDDAGATNAGAAYLFDGRNGSLLASFANPTPAAQDQLGSIVSLGCNVLVGAPHNDGTASDTGAAYLSERVVTASATGQWGPVLAWPQQAIHAILLHDGKVLFFAGAGNTVTHTWNPATNVVQQTPNSARGNHFCSGHAALDDGRIIAFGGVAGFLGLNALTNIFTPATQTWQCPPGGSCTLPDMAQQRFYPTATTLPDGRILSAAGGATNPDLHEVYDPIGNTWTTLTNAPLLLPLYPMMLVLPDGQVLHAGPSVSTAKLNVGAQMWTTLPASHIKGGSAVMYRRGKVLKTGGESQAGPDNPATERGDVIDMTAASPVWREVTAMNFPRQNHNMVALPDGQVLAVGGGLGGAEPTKGILDAELWDPKETTPPDDETWTTMTCMTEPRLYHSTAALLPDGRVVAAGGDGYRSAQVYSPAYLFQGSRPTASLGATTEVMYGQMFQVTTNQSGAIGKVAFVRPSAVTHGFDQNQRYVPLSFSSGSGSVTVTAPANANDAPPGYYMLFLVNSAGIPSEAKFVRLKGCG